MALYKCDYDYDDYDIATPFFDAVKLEAFCYLQHKHSKITWGEKVKHLLIAYFLTNISAQNLLNRTMYVKVRARK